MSNFRLKQILKEAFAGGEKAVSGINPVLKYEDTPLIKDIVEYFKSQKDIKLINILGNGDVWQMDLRCSIEPGLNHQLTREMGKASAYDIKTALEEHLKEKKLNVPNMSIQGISTKDDKCEFTISFIYAYKGNERDLYENSKVTTLLKNVFKEIK